MSFTDKTDTLNKMNTTITSDSDPYLTPGSEDYRIRANNLKQFLTNMFDWIFPTTVSSLNGKSPVITSNNTNYANLSWEVLVPIGTIIQYAGDTAPSGWLLCNGTQVSQTIYANLFAVVAHKFAYVPYTSGQFYLPDFRGKVPMGYQFGAATTPQVISSSSDHTMNIGAIGNKGGFGTVGLSTNEIPKHTHTFTATTGTQSVSHSHSYERISITNVNIDEGLKDPISCSKVTSSLQNTTSASANHTHSVSGTSAQNTSSEAAHENKMPYIVINYIIKY